MTRLSPWQAVLWVLGIGVTAQVAGGLLTVIMQMLARRAGHNLGPLAASVAVPAMLVTGLVTAGGALLVPRVSGIPTRTVLGLRAAPPTVYAAAALGTLMLGPLADLLMQGMATYAPDDTLGLLDGLHALARSQPVWVLWPVLALLPGIGEELMFRGLLLRSFSTRSIGVLASGVGFALFHVDPHHIAGVLPLGLFLSWVASRSSTSVTIVAHVVNNTMALVATHVAALDVGYGTERDMPPSWLPVSLGLFAMCVVEIVRVSRRPTA